MDLFVRIIIPLKINTLYTYSVGNNIPDIAIGSIVLVEFRNKYYYGLIHSKIDTAPSDINIKDIKDIISVVNTLQIIDRKGILLWEHVANYYACNISDIMNLALPVSLNSIKNQSIELNHSNYDNLIESINTKVKHILELIKKYNDGLNTPITVSKLYKLIENKAELNKILFDLERLSIINIERSKPNYISPGYARIQLNYKYKIDWIFQVLKSTKSLTKTLETFLKLKDLKENVLIIDLLENGCNKNSVEKLISRRILAIEPLGVEKATLDTTNAILKDVLLTEEQHEAEQIIKKNLQNLDSIYIGQLYGMGDSLTFNLANAGLKAAKYVPYGPVEKAFPYLVRRVDENTSVAGQMNREAIMLKQELIRRKQKDRASS
ncbi:MAG: proline dehydrogenase family protein [Solitalea-like symbiont of Acarus siro]